MKLAGLFGDKMVLQRGIPVPVWGWAQPMETVTVELAGSQASAVADDKGAWRINLPVLEAGGPHNMTVAGKHNTLVLNNVMVGEVWICSGQSNMGWPVKSSANADVELSAAAHTDIRLYIVPKLATLVRQADIESNWLECSPETAGDFSAVAYFFGRELHQLLGVPIGLIQSAWGGTMAEAWISREGLLNDPSFQPIVAELDQALANAGDDAHLAQQKILDECRKREIPSDPGPQAGHAAGLADAKCDASGWPIMELPQYWQHAGHNYNGVFWFRKEVDIPNDWVGRTLRLSLGACDKSDDTYFNNVRIGGINVEQRSDAWCRPRKYDVPGSLVKPGRNLVAVRVFSHVYAGGFTGPAAEMYLDAASKTGTPPIPLMGSWRYHVEHDFGLTTAGLPRPPPGEGDPNTPANLFNGMIAPLIPFSHRGVIWYQGESNAGGHMQYRQLFSALICDWRRQWQSDDTAFYYVQLANYMARSDTPTDSNWARLREAQAQTLTVPRTGMAVAIDVGDAVDIHPKNKQDVGRRLALNALSQTYGLKNIAPCGPLYAGMVIENGVARLRFKHADGGLVARGGKPLTGFAIAGEDRRFVWAQSVIRNNEVYVSSPAAPNPVAVRYAWADNPECNLYNGAGLPAAPFRTDAWQYTK